MTRRSSDGRAGSGSEPPGPGLHPLVHFAFAQVRRSPVEQPLVSIGVPPAECDQPAIEVVVERNGIHGLRTRFLLTLPDDTQSRTELEQ